MITIRTLLLLSSIDLLHLHVPAQCDDLFVSEIVEGTGGLMAMEIYNPSNATIGLDDYYLRRFPDGSWVTQGYLQLSGSLAAQSTLVLKSAQLSAAGIPFDGNDAFTLEYIPPGGDFIIDVFGEPGVDPGTGWTDDAAANYTDALGATPWTMDHTLVRKTSVLQGLTTPPSPFNVTLEWDSLSVNTTSGLGAHTCDRQSVGTTEAISEAGLAIVQLGPGSPLLVSASTPFQRVLVHDPSGRMFSEHSTGGISNCSIPVNGSTGVVFVQVNLMDGQTVSRKVLLW